MYPCVEEFFVPGLSLMPSMLRISSLFGILYHALRDISISFLYVQWLSCSFSLIGMSGFGPLCLL